MTKHVAGISFSMEDVAFANLANQQESLEQKKFDLELKILECASNDQMVA